MRIGFKVLVIEDDHSVAGGIVRGLRRAGYEVDLAVDGPRGYEAARRGQHDAIVLDLGLPGLDGTEILQRIRSKVSAPVIVVSARSELTDRLGAFDLGAVDFVAKPFWIDELLARLQVRLARRSRERGPAIGWGAVRVDLEARIAYVDDRNAGLTRAEFDVLAHLIERPDRALTRAQIAGGALRESEVDERTVDSHIGRLRKKLGDAGAAIQTVWGIGYRFSPPSPG
ncbi:MAG: response regulator transcription factor [Myxococcota bacterium]